jgi:hypothetical protein
VSGHQQGMEDIYRWRDELRRLHRGGDTIRALQERIKNEKGRRFSLLRLMLAQEYEAQGHYTAADNIYRGEALGEVSRWYEAATSGGADAILILLERLRRELDAAKRREIKAFLAHHYREVYDCAASEAIYLELFDAYPHDPVPLISLAEQKLYGEDRPEEAMRVIDRAVDAAFRAGGFRRNALTVKARIASQMKDYRTVEDTLRRIMGLNFGPGNIDTGFFRDFFDRLPPGGIDSEVARRYDAYVRAGDVDWERRVKESRGLSA